VVFDYHALVTDRAGTTLTLQADHRDHAEVELVIGDLKDGALAHLPQGCSTPMPPGRSWPSWRTTLAGGTLAAAGGGWAGATVGTLRCKLVSMPGRLVCSGRRLRLRAPSSWRWRPAVQQALSVIAAIPAPA
jgi:hypothetical protein